MRHMLGKSLVQPCKEGSHHLLRSTGLTVVASGAVEVMKRAQDAQSLLQRRRLTRHEDVELAVADEDGHLDLLDEIADLILLGLGDELKGRMRVEGPQALVQTPGGHCGELVGGAQLEQLAVELLLLAGLEQGNEVGREWSYGALVKVPDAVDGDHRLDPGLEGRHAQGQDGAQRVAEDGEAVLVDNVRLVLVEPVDHGGADVLPLRDEADVLVPAHRVLPGTLVRDAVPAPEHRRRAEVVVRVLLRRVEAVADDERGQLGRLARACPVPDGFDGEVLLPGGDADPLPRDGQGGDGLVEGAGLLGPQGHDVRVAPVLVDEEVGATEVIGRGEPGVSDVDGIVGVLRVLGLFLCVVGQLVELLVVRCHVPGLDVVGDTEHRANVRPSSEGQAQGDQEIEVERRVGAQGQGRCLGG